MLDSSMCVQCTYTYMYNERVNKYSRVCLNIDFCVRVKVWTL